MVELVFVLDRSGSMAGFESDVIGSFNAMIARQQKASSQTRVSTILFSNHCELLHDRVPLHAIPPMTSEDYWVQGCSSLLDGIGTAICMMKEVYRALPETEQPEKVLFAIMTDGHENSSVMFSLKEIRQMIRKQTEESHWDFLFLGADMNAISIASKMAVQKNLTIKKRLHANKKPSEYDRLGNVIRTYHPQKFISSRWESMPKRLNKRTFVQDFWDRH